MSAIAVGVLAAGASVVHAGSSTERASVSSQGTEASASSTQPSLSANGKSLVFVSSADDLVADDTNGAADVFVRNLKKGKTKRVSVGRKGAEANGPSSDPSLSANGRYLAFVSSATNLAKKDENEQADVFVRDLKKGKTKRLSLGKNGAEPNCACFEPVISGNGRVVAFASFASNLVKGDRNDSADVFVRSTKKGKTKRVSLGGKNTEGEADSYQPTISASGRLVAFASDAENLVKGDSNGRTDVLVRDVKTRKTKRVSRGLEGEEPSGDSLAPSISANGKSVAFSSSAPNLVEDDLNGVVDVFVSPVSKGKAKRVSLASDGTEANDESLSPSLSVNGKSVAFHSYADNLVSGDENGVRDIFVHVIRSGNTARSSVSSSGDEGNGESFAPTLDGKGRRVAFGSSATNLVGDDTNGVRDVFVR